VIASDVTVRGVFHFRTIPFRAGWKRRCGAASAPRTCNTRLPPEMDTSTMHAPAAIYLRDTAQPMIPPTITPSVNVAVIVSIG
jgi:hypothetical protein